MFYTLFETLEGKCMKAESLSFETANGGTTAYVAKPDESSEKAVIVIQEWWGLNDHIKDISNRYAGEGFIAIDRKSVV